MKRSSLPLAILLVLVLSPASVAAQVAGNVDAPPARDAIVALPPGLGALLEGLPVEARDRVRARAARWQAWSPAERAAFAERVHAWDALPVRSRMARRETWRAWEALPDPEREQVAGMAREFATRPAGVQQEQRLAFEALEPSARRGWMLGPVLGADYAALHGFLAQVPPGQHGPLIDVLRGMSAAQRAQLSVLVQRTPPQARDGLRLDLIATPPARRQEWLWEQMDR